VADYRAALEVRTRDRAPLAWAHSQRGLANALAAIAKRRKSAAVMDEALVCMRNAVEVYQQGGVSYWLPIGQRRVAEMEVDLADLRR
jgi:hypothetical protein